MNTWRYYLGAEASSLELEDLRRNTHTGRPLGESAFVQTSNSNFIEASTLARAADPQTIARTISKIRLHLLLYPHEGK